MGVLSSLFGSSNDTRVNAPTNNYQADPAALAQSQFGDLIRQAASGATSGQGPSSGTIDQQNQLAQMLFARARGEGGPSLAQQQLRDSTQQTTNQIAGAVAGQRGVSPALMARLIARGQAGAQQQAAGQGAELRSQEQLAAENQLGSVLGQTQAGQVAQQQANTSLLGTAAGAQNSQNATNVQNVLGTNQINAGTAQQNANLNLKAQEDNAGIAAENAKTNSGIAGNLLGGVASIGAHLLHNGGEVPGYADGGIVIPGLGIPDFGGGGDEFGKGFKATAPASGSSASFADMLKGKKATDPAVSADATMSPAPSGPSTFMKWLTAPTPAGYGNVVTTDLARDQFANPSGAPGPFAAPPMNFKAGGSVPGRAAVAGDSPKNDTVPAMLSPGEDVLPRSVTQSSNPPEAAKRFVEQLMAKKEAGQGTTYANVLALKRAREAAEAHYQALCRGGMAGYADGGEVKETGGGSGGAGGKADDKADHSPSILERIHALLSGHSASNQTAAVNQNERKQFDQVQGYADGGPVVGDPEAERSVDYANLPNLQFTPDGQPIMPSGDPTPAYQAPERVGPDPYAVKTLLTPEPAPASPFARTDAPAVAPPGPAAVAEGVPPMLARPPEAAPVAAPATAPTAPAVVAAPPGFDANERKLEAATLQKAKTDAAMLDETAKFKQTAADSLAAMAKQHADTLAGRQAKADQMFQDLQDPKNKIDPGHFWSERGAGSKVTAAISILLGGLGAGLAHTQNQATAILQDRINQDIDAQKANLGQKNNMLSHYLGQTKDIVSAQQYAKADLLDVSAAQLQSAAAKFGSKQAMDGAAVEVANLRKQAMAQRQEAQLRQLEIDKGKLQLGLTAQWQKMAAGQQDQGYIPSSAHRPMFTGDPQAYLKDKDERKLELPEFGPGAHTYVKDDKVRADVEDTLGGLNHIAEEARHVASLANTHGGAIHIPGTDARARYDSFVHSLSTELNGMQGLKRLNDNEFEAFSGMIPTQREWLSAAGQAKISNLLQMVQAKKMQIYQQKLGLDPSLFRARSFTPAG